MTVEHRQTLQDSFGHGIKEQMRFGEVLKRLDAGDWSLYLTTQEQVPGPDGHPEIFSPPISLLTRDFPLQPKLVGSLVPQQINFWAGCAHEGASSGLHHDFHDNLYVLLQGKKRFRLFPPSSIEGMYTVGKHIKVYPNGRVMYETQEDVLADGSSAHDVRVWEARQRAEQAFQSSQRDPARSEPGDRFANGEDDDEIDDALDALLDAVMDADAEHDPNDDYDAMEAFGSVSNESCNSYYPPQSDFGKRCDRQNGGSADDTPPSFSQIDVKSSRQYQMEKFPKFPGLDSAVEIVVESGQCLYLPAGEKKEEEEERW